MPQRTDLRAYAALTLGVVAISWSAIFVRWTNMPGVSSAFYRVLIAALIVWAILLVRRSPLHLRSSSIALAALGGAFFAGDVGLYNIAVLRTSAGNATFLGNNAPLFVGLLTWALTRKLPSARFWIAFATALAGAALIVFADLHHSPTSLVPASTTRTTADIMAVIASLCFALYLLVTENLRSGSEDSTQKAGSTLTLLAISSTSSAAVLLLCATFTQASLHIPSAASLASLAGLGVICQLVGYFCLTYALGHLPATVSSIVMLAVAPLTAILAFALFHEQMTFLQLLGGALVLVGVWIISRSHTPPPEPTNLAA